MTAYNEIDTKLLEGSISEVASALRWLGNGDAHTNLGAIENLSWEISKGITSTNELLEEGFDRVADSLAHLSEAIHRIAEAIESKS
jgi:hypothetical protein